MVDMVLLLLFEATTLKPLTMTLLPDDDDEALLHVVTCDMCGRGRLRLSSVSFDF